MLTPFSPKLPTHYTTLIVIRLNTSLGRSVDNNNEEEEEEKEEENNESSYVEWVKNEKTKENNE